MSHVETTSEAPSYVAAFGIPLYSYRAVPSFLQGNPYITEGYRAYLSPKLCVKRSVHHQEAKWPVSVLQWPD